MPYLLEDLVIDRVDLVDEGANSAAFIELYKRKERSATMDIKEILSKMKPEHSAVIQAELDKLSGEVTKAKEDLAIVTTECNTAKQDLAKAKEDLKAANEGKEKAAFDEEEILKSIPAAAHAMFIKMRTQKEAAEEEVRKAKEAEAQAEAVAKAAELKALPIETDKLVDVLKNCSAEMVDVLTTINAAVEGTVLNEVGKSNAGSKGADAWSKIEAKADEIAKRDNVTKQKAVSITIKENPELYKEYLQGGAN